MALATRLLRPLRRLHDLATNIGTGRASSATVDSGLAEIDTITRALSIQRTARGGQSIRERAFSSDASHQLRTPITGLRLTLENELEHPRPVPGEAIGEALRDIDQLESTIEGLLNLARDTMHRRSLIDCTATIAGRVGVARRNLATVGRSVRFVEPTEPILVRASTTAIGEILDVLLSNAQRHARGTITVTVEQLPELVAINVADEDPGLTNPTAAFGRRAAGAHGTGIGLALARRLAKTEGGSLTLAQLQPFCCFELLIPAPRY